MNTSKQKTNCEQETQLSVDTTPDELSVETTQILDELPPLLANQNRYRVIRELGKGGMGKVYLAEHSTMNRLVAIKVIRKELIGDDQAVQRFRSEILATAKLSHPNVVTAYDAESNNDNGSCYLVTEYVDGCNLSELMSRQTNAIPVSKSCDLILQAANGLQHALDYGLVHRDIKPHNLLIDTKGTVKVADFGLALIRDAEGAARTKSGMILGTVDYMAPEQATDSHAVDTRSDIYALGCTLFHLLAGRAPFDGGSIISKLQRHATAPRPSCAGDNIPPELDMIVRKAMDCDPAKRFQKPKDIADALIPFRSSSTQTASGSRKPPILKYVASATLPLLVLAGWVVTVATDNGSVVIESSVDDIEVVVMQGGKTIQLLDGSTGSRLRLRSGAYELDLRGERNSAHVAPSEFRLLRGETQVVRITKGSPRNISPQVTEHDEENNQELERQLLGWYDGERGMRLTILPVEGKLVGVIDWGNAAPCSVYDIRVDRGAVSFWQPVDEVMSKIERQDDPSKISSIILLGGLSEVRFAKQVGLAEIVGQFANAKNQVMKVSHRKGELYCSIDWGGNSPLTNGFIRAAPNGTTIIQGFKWQEELSIDVFDGILRAIILRKEKFTPIAGQAIPQDAEQSDPYKSSNNR